MRKLRSLASRKAPSAGLLGAATLAIPVNASPYVTITPRQLG
jgi:hypothetical protein